MRSVPVGDKMQIANHWISYNFRIVRTLWRQNEKRKSHWTCKSVLSGCQTTKLCPRFVANIHDDKSLSTSNITHQNRLLETTNQRSRHIAWFEWTWNCHSRVALMKTVFWMPQNWFPTESRSGKNQKLSKVMRSQKESAVLSKKGWITTTIQAMHWILSGIGVTYLSGKVGRAESISKNSVADFGCPIIYLYHSSLERVPNVGFQLGRSVMRVDKLESRLTY